MVPWVVICRRHLGQSRKPHLPGALGAKGAIRPFRISLPRSSFNISTCKPSNIPTFGFPYLLPSSVSRKSFACHSYENCQRVYQQFPFWFAPNAGGGNSKLCARQHAVNPLACGRRSFLPLCALCVLCDLCVKSFFSFSRNFQLWTLYLRPPPTCLLLPIPYPLSFHTLAHSFALFCTQQKRNSFFFKRFRTLCTKKECGKGAHRADSIRLSVQQRLLSLCLVLPRITGHGSRPTILRS